MSDLSTNQRQKLQRILERIKGDLGLYCRAVHSDTFIRPFSPNHLLGLQALDDTSIQKLLIVAHRNWGKSSIINKAYPAREIIFEQSPYIVPVSATASLSLLLSSNLRMELESNQVIKALIGSVKSKNFSKEQWVTAPRANSPNGIMVMPRGTGQQIRGINYGSARPRTLIFDDLETKEGVFSADQRDKTKRWFYSDFMNTVDQSLPWRMIGIGTVLHRAALLNELKGDPSWTVLDFPIADPITMESNWPEYMSTEQIAEKKDEYERAGMIEEFYLEFMNECSPDEIQNFKREYFREFDPTDIDFSGPQWESIIIVDPARSQGPTSAKTAIIGVTVNMSKQSIYVRDIINERLLPDEMYPLVFDMAERLDAQVIGWDDGGLVSFIQQGVMNEMHRRGKVYTIEWLKNHSYRTKNGTKVTRDVKEGRIECLIPYYRMGQILHAKGVCNELEAQLLSAKNGLIDVADALSYVIQMLYFGERYMHEDSSSEEEDAEMRSEFADEDKAFAKLCQEDEVYV